MTEGVRLTVNVSEGNWSGIEDLMAREGLTETQAVHHVLWYGLFLYRTLRIERKKVVIHYGNTRSRLRLECEDPDSPDSEVGSANK
ncbi:hypothetical protein GCM10010178_42480 [Lentzea flava]|uniref:Ribbon-helix-helix protein, copG family n=1 Tax=Lentzea flava TaxID=103732 RepID=A0ABQ2UPL3_9PSEU|nr:hypothetical protein [Lentzea flava]GGU45555.1 hypothetical protein GCM10010178_42480 [Lentzea flava]